MIPSMIDPGTPTDFGPLHAPTADYEQPSQGHDRTVRVILEVIFISTAVFALIMGLLLRLMCLRRDHRPLTDFLNPLPPPPGHMRHDREASPHPSHGTTHSEQMRQTIFLPTLPLTAPQHPPAAYIVPGAPALSLLDPEAHPHPRAWRDRTRKRDPLPVYDLGAPPKYEDALLHSPSSSEASSSSRPHGGSPHPGLRRSVSM